MTVTGDEMSICTLFPAICSSIEGHSLQIEIISQVVIVYDPYTTCYLRINSYTMSNDWEMTPPQIFQPSEHVGKGFKALPILFLEVWMMLLLPQATCSALIHCGVLMTK